MKLKQTPRPSTQISEEDNMDTSNGHLRLVLTEVQYALISPTPFAYPTHMVLLIIPDGTTAYTNSNIRISHTKEVRLFREVTGLEQALFQKIVGTAKADSLVDNRNRTTNYIKDTVLGVLSTCKKTTVS